MNRKPILIVLILISLLGWFPFEVCSAVIAENNEVVGELIRQAADNLSSDAPDFDEPLFAFEYGGLPSGLFLNKWNRNVRSVTETTGQRQTVTWDDPQSGFRVEWSVLLYSDHDAAEMRLAFENRGTRPSEVIRNVRPLVQSVSCPVDVVCAKGGLAAPTDFGPLITRFTAGTPDLRISADGGWSSNRNLPFWLLVSPEGGGFYYGLGWTGQWAARFRVTEKGQLRLEAGMEYLNLRLQPGERITQPTILIGHFTGDRMAGHNALRRILNDRYVPLLDGKKLLGPVADESWIPFGNGINEKLVLEQVEAMAGTGIEVLLLDPGWYRVDFWDAGDWRVNPVNFPHGLEPIAAALASKGMKMGLWMDPERVTDKCYEAFPRKDILVPASQKPVKEGGRDIKVWLVDLAMPQAQQWMIETIGQKVRSIPLGWLHWDLNYPPLEMWQNRYKDEPDRLGIEEIRYVEGLYKVLDALRINHPGLIIHWSAGSGRRIDLETIRRCHVLAKSDLVSDAGHMMLCASNLFFPGNLVGIASGSHSRYDYYRHFAGPFLACYDFRNLTSAQIAEGKACIDRYKQIRGYLGKDYYSLFEYSLDPKLWSGWQFHDPDKNEGFFMVFRQPEARNAEAVIKLCGLELPKVYVLHPDIRCNLPESVTGQSLMDGLSVRLEEPRSTLLVLYQTQH